MSVSILMSCLLNKVDSTVPELEKHTFRQLHSAATQH